MSLQIVFGDACKIWRNTIYKGYLGSEQIQWHLSSEFSLQHCHSQTCINLSDYNRTQPNPRISKPQCMNMVNLRLLGRKQVEILQHEKG